jgi:hypothetical protein
MRSGNSVVGLMSISEDVFLALALFINPSAGPTRRALYPPKLVIHIYPLRAFFIGRSPTVGAPMKQFAAV